MTDGTEQTDQPIRRGQAAWKAAVDEIAERNARASKRGREERAVRERRESERRLATERVEAMQLSSRKPNFR